MEGGPSLDVSLTRQIRQVLRVDFERCNLDLRLGVARRALECQQDRTYFRSLNAKARCTFRCGGSTTVGQLVLVRYRLFNVKRWYQPSYLMGIFGDVKADSVGSKMSCERCGKNEFMHVGASATRFG